ncbi:MAG: type II secretion system protein [Granulosicoccaceae bacterium]
MNAVKQSGFSLIELSIVLFISAILLRAAILPLPQLRDAAMRKQTRQQLQDVKQALIGHIIKTGALPCPISLAGSGNTVANCQITEGGVPAVTVGLVGAVSSSGAILDAWGRPLRYALSRADHQSEGTVGLPDWSTTGEIAAIGLARIEADLRICLHADTKCKQHLRTDQLVAIVISDGGDSSAVGVQQENQDGDNDYALIAHSQVDGKAFDDMMITLTSSDVAYWLLRAQWLAP